MKIAIFTDTFPPAVNGVAHVVAQSAMRLALRGHDVRVITTSQGSDAYLQTVSQGKYTICNIYSFPSGVYPDIRLSIPLATTMRQLRGWTPDIVHTHTPFGVGWAAARCATRFGVPLIGTHHTFFDNYLKHVHLDIRPAREMSWKMTIAYYDQCDLVLAPSRSLADELIENGLQAPVQVLPNPIDTELFRVIPNTIPDLTSTGAHLVYMGRLSYEKSLDQVLQVFSMVRNEVPEATLTLIGDGPERKRLRRLVTRWDLQDSVHFTGVLRGEELVHALRQADLFITTSKTDNMPLSVLEAMATGLPVAAVRMKGLPEIVQDGVNGVLAAPDHPAELAGRIIALLGDREMLAAYSVAAETFALGFSQERFVSESEHIYQSIMEIA